MKTMYKIIHEIRKLLEMNKLPKIVEFVVYTSLVVLLTGMALVPWRIVFFGF